MKTILYFIFAIFMFATAPLGYTNDTNAKSILLIQAVGQNASSALLSQSAKIISNRLKDFTSDKFKVNVIPEKNQIQIVVDNSRDLKEVENLVIQRGELAFYETYNHITLSGLLNDDHLFSLLNTSNTGDSSAEMGCASENEATKVNDYLKTLDLNNKCLFAWSRYADHSGLCLYALKSNSGENALITGADIKSVQCFRGKGSESSEIRIRLQKSAVTAWADVTRRNIDQTIAIVMDGQVIAAPVVRSVIPGGHLSITGNFSPSEAKYIAALGNNGELPLSFEIVR